MTQKILAGAISGLVSATAVDLGAFKQWKSVDEARKYDWGIALWRWFQGAVLGMLAAFGMSSL